MSNLAQLLASHGALFSAQNLMVTNFKFTPNQQFVIDSGIQGQADTQVWKIQVWRSRYDTANPDVVVLNIQVNGKVDPASRSLLPWTDKDNRAGSVQLQIQGFVSLHRSMLRDVEFKAFVDQAGLDPERGADGKLKPRWWCVASSPDAAVCFSAAVDSKGERITFGSFSSRGLEYRGRGIGGDEIEASAYAETQLFSFNDFAAFMAQANVQMPAPTAPAKPAPPANLFGGGTPAAVPGVPGVPQLTPPPVPMAPKPTGMPF